jgi:hypothetical protein
VFGFTPQLLFRFPTTDPIGAPSLGSWRPKAPSTRAEPWSGSRRLFTFLGGTPEAAATPCSKTWGRAVMDIGGFATKQMQPHDIREK